MLVLWVDAAISQFQLTFFCWDTTASPSELDFIIMAGVQIGWSGATPSLEPQNHLRWKRPLRSSSPTLNLTFLSSSLSYEMNFFSESYYWDMEDNFQVFCDKCRGKPDRIDCYYPRTTRNSILATALNCVCLPSFQLIPIPLVSLPVMGTTKDAF